MVSLQNMTLMSGPFPGLTLDPHSLDPYLGTLSIYTIAMLETFMAPFFAINGKILYVVYTD